jgi:hypothetical protein
MKRAVIVICDSLRCDLITPEVAPFLPGRQFRARLTAIALG